ncbi:MAG: FHA domain-containing protein [Myxococcaceae bacterium]|nr:FHA domain-containing protein [Myxococcaceae bacterium]
MLRIRELAEVARRLGPERFATQLGPFVLMQRPRPDSMDHDPAAWFHRTAALPPGSVKGPPPPVDFEELLVATLPPAEDDGTLRLTIGRSPDCDLVLHDPAISARHAAIAWDGERGTIQELGSSNGTYLNGIRLGSHASLRGGDAISFGRAQFVFLLTPDLHERLLRFRQE